MRSEDDIVAEAIWQGEWLRGGNSGGLRRVPWSEVSEIDRERYRVVARHVIKTMIVEGIMASA